MIVIFAAHVLLGILGNLLNMAFVAMKNLKVLKLRRTNQLVKISLLIIPGEFQMNKDEEISLLEEELIRRDREIKQLNRIIQFLEMEREKLLDLLAINTK